MKRFALPPVRALWLTAWILFFAAGRPAVAAEGKLTVVATLFPQFDFARSIAGDHADVSLLLPPGAEAHSFEPTPSVMKKIAAADVFVYTGEYMEPWAKRLADAAGGGVNIVDASRGIDLVRGDGEHDPDHAHTHDNDADHGDDGHFHEYDPHIWLDPVLAAEMAQTIARALADADPAHAETYLANGEALRERIMDLHREFAARVAASPRRALVFGERFAFGYFFRRYGLEEIGAYKSCAPGAEPGMKAVIGVIEYVKENGVNRIYLENMATSRISRVVQQETGAEILAVDSLHNPPAEVQKSGATYLDIMRKNMDAFGKGLE